MEPNKQFERIYVETRDDLLRYLMLRTNAHPDVEDLFQEVYRRFYQRLCNGVLPILNPRLYLFSIAKKVLSRHYRSAARRSTFEQPIPEDIDIPSRDEPIEDQLLQEEKKEAVWRILQSEPELSRRAFILFYGYDRSQVEISDALGLSEEAVRQRLYRTRQKIRTMLVSQQDDV